MLAITINKYTRESINPLFEETRSQINNELKNPELIEKLAFLKEKKIYLNETTKLIHALSNELFFVGSLPKDILTIDLLIDEDGTINPDTEIMHLIAEMTLTSDQDFEEVEEIFDESLK